MAQRDVTKQQPIGYWLKHADEVITEQEYATVIDVLQRMVKNLE